MNLLDQIEELYTAHAYITAGSDEPWPFDAIKELLEEYASIAPKADDWEPWMHSIAIDADNEMFAYDSEPTRGLSMWKCTATRIKQFPLVKLNHVPWQWCIWTNPSKEQGE